MDALNGCIQQSSPPAFDRPFLFRVLDTCAGARLEQAQILLHRRRNIADAASDHFPRGPSVELRPRQNHEAMTEKKQPELFATEMREAFKSLRSEKVTALVEVRSFF
jgi:hypothetical protein